MKYSSIIKNAILFLVLIICLSSCSSIPKGYGKTFRYDVMDTSLNLDPQIADNEASIIVLNNVMTGLFQRDIDNNIIPSCVESYEVSQDRLEYLFTLKDDLKWYDSAAKVVGELSAYDFEFAFKRLFDIGDKAGANQYRFIKNAQKILDKELTNEDIGVKALDAKTLKISLDYQCEDFFELLTLHYSFPCNRELFYDTKGNYGLERDSLFYNYGMYISYWEEGVKVFLSKNKNYYDAKNIAPAGVNLYMQQDRSTILSRYQEGVTDVISITGNEYDDFEIEQHNVNEFVDTTWVLAFNQNKSVFSHQKIRQSISSVIDKEKIAQSLPQYLKAANSILPPILKQDNQEIGLNNTTSITKDGFNDFLTEIGGNPFPKVSLMCVDDDEIMELAQLMQLDWQKKLALHINLKPLSKQEFDTALKNSDYDIAIMPIKSLDNKVENFFKPFYPPLSQTMFGFNNPSFNQEYQKLALTQNTDQYHNIADNCEDMLLSQYVVLPLFHQTTYFLTSNQTEQIGLNHFVGGINFKYAVKYS